MKNFGRLAPRDRGRVFTVIACNKREAFVQGSEATKQSILSLSGEMDCFAALAMTEAGIYYSATAPHFRPGSG